MVIDLTDLMVGNSLNINDKVDILNDKLNGTSIRKLNDVYFKGNVIRLSDNDYQIIGDICGSMVLPDDITLEDVNYSFVIPVEEDFNEYDEDSYLKIIQNRLDISDFLWQNILVEVPTKIKKKENENLTLEGDGWRLVSEDELNKENNSPLSELSKMFDSGKE